MNNISLKHTASDENEIFLSELGLCIKYTVEDSADRELKEVSSQVVVLAL